MSSENALSQIRTSSHQLFSFPENGRIVEENPPCLSWLLCPDDRLYRAEIYDDNGNIIWSGETKKNYIVPDIFLSPGKYSWNLFSDGDERGIWEFTISDDAVKIHRTDAKTLYDAVPTGHPNHLFSLTDIEEIKEKKSAQLEVLRRNVELAYKDGMPSRPMYHRDVNALPYREYFGRFRDYCDRNLVACSLYYTLTGDEKAGKFAKELFLTICDMNPNGPCSLVGRWGDEVGLSCARCLPSVYDMLFPLLDVKERDYTARTVYAYAAQCSERLARVNFCANPGDSHTGRIAAYLGEAAMVLKDSGIQKREEAIEWLDCALDIYGGIFPHFGTPDGGWAEGTFYSTSYTKWYLPFFSAVERYTGCSFLDRPFYRHVTDYFLHFASPDYENHPFGDGYWCSPTDAEWPGFFAQNPFRIYAERSGNRAAISLSKRLDTPEIYLLHLLDIFLPERENGNHENTEQCENIRTFPDAGFAVMHSNITDTEKDITVMARASKFGPGSHRHPDNGSFALFAGGTALISPSGYFGREYGTAHHMKWLNSTKAHNAILVDGEGQKIDLTSVGAVVSCTENGDERKTVLDLSPSYDSLEKWVRTITLSGNTITVTDEIECVNESEITYCLHTLSRPDTDGENVTVERNGHRLTASPVCGVKNPVISDKFDTDLNEGVPEEYKVTMPEQFHIYYTSEKEKSHRIVVTYTVS